MAFGLRSTNLREKQAFCETDNHVTDIVIASQTSPWYSLGLIATDVGMAGTLTPPPLLNGGTEIGADTATPLSKRPFLSLVERGVNLIQSSDGQP